MYLCSLLFAFVYVFLFTFLCTTASSQGESEVLWADVAIVLAARAPVGPLPSEEEHVKDMFAHFLRIFLLYIAAL